METMLSIKSFFNSTEQTTHNGSATAQLTCDSRNDTFRDLGPAYSRQLRIVILMVMIATSFCGNVAVIVSICLPGRQKMKRIQVMFLNLAAADLSVSAFTMTSQLIWEWMVKEWVAGEEFCLVFKVLQTYTMVCSNYLIVAVALDRFMAVVFPLRMRPNIWNYLIGAWVLALIPALPNAYVFHLHTDLCGRTSCVAKFYTGQLSVNDRRWYMVLIVSIVFVLPIAIIFVVYGWILHVVQGRHNPFGNQWSSVESVVPTNTIVRENGVHSGRSRSTVKTFWMTGIVVLSFLVCATPYSILELITAFGDSSGLDDTVVAVLGITSAANSSINPYVYLASNWNCLRKESSPQNGIINVVAVHSKKDSSRAVVSTNV